MILIVAPRLLSWLDPSINALAFYPFVLVKRKYMASDPVLINHEKIHLRQQLEMLLLPFYLVYFTHYLFNYLRFREHYKAYRHNVFELEAYAHEQDLNYLKSRPFWGFLQYAVTAEKEG
jgi:hypothetical protein